MEEEETKPFFYSLIAFMLLFYIFNLTIVSGGVPIYITILFNLAFPILSFFFIILSYVLKKKKLTKYKLLFFLISFVVSFIFINRNGNIKYKANITLVVYNLLSIFLPYLLCENKKLINAFMNIMPIFFIEHIVGVLLQFLFPRIYLNIFINGYFINAPIYIRNYMLSIYNSGFMAGFSSHYSSTGIYLSISLIYFFYQIIVNKNKKKKNIILFILSLITLLMTGKRAVLVFSLFSCIFIYLYISKSFKSLFKFVTITIFGIIMIYIAGLFIPAVNNTFIRFTQGDIDSNLGNRSQLYDYAKIYYKKSPLIGNGWSTFKYSFNENVSNYDKSGMLYDCHNIYLQLLCETGIIGFIIIVTVMISVFAKSLLLLRNNLVKNDKTYYNLLIFSSIFQLFFLLYGITGNPLYDIHCYIIYLLAIAITLLCLFRSKTMTEVKYEKNIYSNISSCK